jgi:thymidine kinase
MFFVVGPVKSGKSVVAIELNEIVEEKGIKNRNLAFAQPSVDRPDVPKNKIFSRVGKELKATSFGSKSDIEKIFHENEVVVIDEVQFTPADLQSYLLSEITLFLDRGGIFVGLGLDYTSQGGEFVFAALLKSRAEKVYKLQSLCQMCGRMADKYCQRLIDGVPAGLDTPALLSPSINVTYEPRCDECFVVKK